MTDRPYQLHLISDSTGETVSTLVRACTVQFEGVEVEENIWPMVRTERQLQKVLDQIADHPGMVLYTLVDDHLREILSRRCQAMMIPCVNVLEPLIAAMAQHFGTKSRGQPGRQHVMDAEYFARIDAINFVMNHDDGQHTADLSQADVILVGVSRTSKTPTCIYLANRGIKAANVPIVPDHPLPPVLESPHDALVVGLTEDPARLVQIRRNRMRMFEGEADGPYTDLAAVKAEVAAARRLFSRRGWPVIDVTRRSIEETAAAVLKLLAERRSEVDA